MEGLLVLLAIGAVVAFLVGPILGIIAYVRTRREKGRYEILEGRLWSIERRLGELEQGGKTEPSIKVGEKPAEETVADRRELLKRLAEATATAKPAEPPPVPAPDTKLEAEPVAPVEAPLETVGADTTNIPVPERAVAVDYSAPPPGKDVPVTAAAPEMSFEMKLGTRWINWVGAVMVIIGAGYGLKYAYDNQWIGPMGRIAIGTGFGIGAMMLGERFRRKDWSVLFQTLTGLGLAIFYLCIFFSFQIYKLSNQTMSFGLAIGVTALAVTLAVAHNTVSIAIIAVIGGFLSPVLVSTGENHPYSLFSYIAILNLVALAAAYFRKWRALDFLCFAGTSIMMVGWFARFYYSDPAGPDSQMKPALIFITLFYLMFLLIPTLYTMMRGLPETTEGIVLVLANALFSLLMYYRVLYRDHTQMLGFVVLGQALLVFLLFQVWIKRVGQRNETSQSLLLVALALITVAVPLHLKFYGVPIAWALEGTLMIHVGIRFRNAWPRIIGLVALGLAAYKLWERIPLHTAMFTPVINVPFGSWMLVAAAAFLGAWIWNRAIERSLASPPAEPFAGKITDAGAPIGAGEFLAAAAVFVLGFVVTCAALTFEVGSYWGLNRPTEEFYQTSRYHMFSSLVVLWSLISAGTITVLHRMRLLKIPQELLVWGCYLVGAGFSLVGLGWYKLPSTMLFLNALFLPRLMFSLSLLWGGQCMSKSGHKPGEAVLETAGQVLLAALILLELDRWAGSAQVINHRMALALVSAAWALQALALIWVGLLWRCRLRRILGFVLFGIVVAKVLLVDTSELERVYRIVSFVASGLLLMVAGYFYQRYGSVLMSEEKESEGTNP
ncbi:MAG: DUF2339 domain-containing protein [Candidatus Sumerlaeaceae bacterium]|nr:DUF2339 domain-containing protein [Candidatus Sumerlaeaceae bacterium]